MRRCFLCFLLCLAPLRLWAGVWMPMATSAVYPGLAKMAVTVQPEVDVPHDCHGGQAVLVHETHVSLQEILDSAGQKSDCHDGTCQLCGACHQSANLAVWPAIGSFYQTHPQPVGTTLSPVVRTAPPLIKPPIF